MSDTPETDSHAWSDHSEGILHEVVEANFARKLERERDEWKNKAYSHATDYTLMEAKCFRLEQQLKEYDQLKS
jgi:hypothetical protein